MITVEQMRNRRWRWVFREPDKKLELVSNEDYDSLDAAQAAAAAAYPGVRIETRQHGGRKQRSKVTAAGEGSGCRARERSGGRADDVARKIGRWLTPVVVLMAWSKSKRDGR